MCMILTTVGSFYLQGEVALSDLLLNLSAEIFGIVVTVFVIERIIAWRESRAWLPARRGLHEKLLDIITDLMRDLTQGMDPPNLGGEDVSVDERNKRLRDIEEQLRRRYVTSAAGPIISQLRSGRRSRVPKRELSAPYDRVKGSLTKARVRLSEAMDVSAALLEAELLAMLQVLEREISGALADIDDAWKDINHRRTRSDGEMFPRMPEQNESLEEHGDYAKYLHEALGEIYRPLTRAIASVLKAGAGPKPWLEVRLPQNR